MRPVKYQIGASDVFIEERDLDSWAIVRFNYNLTKDRKWVRQPIPSNLTENFLKSARYKTSEDAHQTYILHCNEV